MPTLKENHEHLTHLSREFRKLGQRTGQAHKTATGFSDFGPGNAHDPALNEAIDWFYRRWAQQVEGVQQWVLLVADKLEAARLTYQATDDKVRAAAGQHPAEPRAQDR